MSKTKVIVIGGGAAGFFAAINTAKKHPDYSISILEKSNKLLSKVRISGGGRCNVTHACYENQLLVKNYPRGEKELRSVFSRFSVNNTIEWFNKHGVELKTENDGRIFPSSNSSESIVNCLLGQAEKHKIAIQQNFDVTGIKVNNNGTFSVHVNNDDNLVCDKLIIATGGNPKAKAYEWLEHAIVPPVPSLFTFNIPNKSLTELMGVSVTKASIRVPKAKLQSEGPLLITHWGISGPAILKASAWGAKSLHELNYNFSVFINWTGDESELSLRTLFEDERIHNGAKLTVKNNPLNLPRRLWEYLVNKANINDTVRWADLSKKLLNTLINHILNDEYPVQGKTTFKEEFVTCGGVSLKEIDLSSMQSKKIKNLYFAGEVIDVDGITGGFNFQNAWSTAWIVSENI